MVAVLSVEGLTVVPTKPVAATPIVNGVSFSVASGEVYALVGESGSGKTITSRAILKLLPPGTAISDGRILLGETDIAGFSTSAMLNVRGRQIGMVFQEPMTSLNPALTIGKQLTEAQVRHFGKDPVSANESAIEMLERLRVPEPRASLRRYPHEFSGGLRQRILLAGVLALHPDIVIADEPTTALDVIVQKEVLDLMVRAVREIGSSMLLITHDLGVVAKYADRVGVMCRGELLEEAATDALLRDQKHDYTRKLFSSVPQLDAVSDRSREESAEVVAVSKVVVEYTRRRFLPWRAPLATRVLDNIDLVIRSGDTVGIVGESGSGKTTLAKALLGLVPAVAGRIRVCQRDITRMSERQLRATRRRVQIVFQDPYSALDPRLRVDRIIGEGLRHVEASRSERYRRVHEMLKDVGLASEHARRYPHQLSGGQRQRVNIARALIANPELIIADEPVSALDVTVQAEILQLFRRLRDKWKFACMFISHDLSVVEVVADRVVVVYRGEIVEEGTCGQIFKSPRHPYTTSLLRAAPRLVREAQQYRLAASVYESRGAPSSHEFDGWQIRPSPRQPHRVQVAAGHWVSCYVG